MKRTFAILLLPVLLLALQGRGMSHCEIPCGIYWDEARFSAIGEDLRTIEKSMQMIGKLSSDPAGNVNQLTRWVLNKEEHADHIREVIAQYFLAQRVKVPADDDSEAYSAYTKKLVILHKMIVTAMKCKQTTEVGHVQALHDLTHEFQELYQTGSK